MSPRHTVGRWLLALLLIGTGAASPALSATPDPVFPGAQWQHIEQTETAGYSPQKLAVLRNYLESVDTTAMMVVVGGRSLFEYSDIAHVSVLASARKSVLVMLYGKYVQDGTIRLDQTLAELKFDDIDGLSATEQQAAIEHLLTARASARPAT